MTGHKHLKLLIRARMEKTGERYATARRHIIAQNDEPAHTPVDPASQSHTPGNIPATTALRILLTHAGIRAPHTGHPFSEAMLFGIAGGIGIGIFSFYYEKEDVATFYIGGRHLWHSDQQYLTNALARLGVPAIIQEAGGAKAGEALLRTALAEHGPGIAWVDQGELPHRAAPGQHSGSGYHVITVYRMDDTTALIGDLTDHPITIALPALGKARTRIKKDRQRILSIGETGALPPLKTLVYEGLHACYDGLLHPTLPMAQSNARLEALQTWASRMEGTQGKERWERIYRPGPNLLRGLCSLHDFIEHYGTGGGLCRPLFADFLREAAGALQHPPLAALAEQYQQLGQDWSILADTALPDDLEMLATAKALLTRKAELLHSGAAAEELHAIWEQLNTLEQQASEAFPLSEAAYRELRIQLHAQIAALYTREIAAHAAIPQAIAGLV